MPHALNLTIPIAQDEATQKRLAQVAANFSTTIQPRIDEVLRKSKLVHFARVVVIDNKYLQVLTEYDGDHKAYTEFFRKELPDVFATLFSLAEGASTFGELDSENFYRIAEHFHRPSLGETTLGETDDSGKPEGYLFAAYEKRTVRDVLAKL
jgi:hypothetical protein